MKKFIKEFKEFALKGNVMSMAVGVIIGGAFSGIVTALTTDFINPLIASFGGAEVVSDFFTVYEELVQSQSGYINFCGLDVLVQDKGSAKEGRLAVGAAYPFGIPLSLAHYSYTPVCRLAPSGPASSGIPYLNLPPAVLSGLEGVSVVFHKRRPA